MIPNLLMEAADFIKRSNMINSGEQCEHNVQRLIVALNKQELLKPHWNAQISRPT